MGTVINPDLRWRDDNGFVHYVIEREKDVWNRRRVRYWAVVCGVQAFTEARPPRLVDEPCSCLECLAEG